MTSVEPRVVVVGGGPVGLSAALLLSRRGIPCTVLEQDAQPGTHPKARGIRTRTMELLTQWGIADEVRREALPAEASRFIYCDSLVGAEVARSPQVEAGERASLASDCRLAQNALHSILLKHVTALPRVNYRPGVGVAHVKSNDDGVVLDCQDGSSVCADYVIAADGVASTVRSELGIEFDGDAVLGYGQSVFWRGDLHRWVHDRLCIQFITGDRTGHPANIASVDGRHYWVTMVMQPGTVERPTPPTQAEARDIIRHAVGEQIEPEILDIATWRISALVARQWRVGRVFLAGDAAHSFPPTGGFGMNTGIQDVHNLVWKLALVMGGAAGDALLDTYEHERKQIAESNAAWSRANGVRFRSISRAIANGDDADLARLIEDQRHHVDATDQDLGFGYAKGAFLLDTSDLVGSALTTALPGHRFPECRLRSATGATVSSVQTFDDGFYIVATEPLIWRHPAFQAVQRFGLPIEILGVISGADQPDPLGGHDAAIVRPDGIVAWIGNLGARSADEVLEVVLSSVLS